MWMTQREEDQIREKEKTKYVSMVSNFLKVEALIFFKKDALIKKNLKKILQKV